MAPVVVTGRLFVNIRPGAGRPLYWVGETREVLLFTYEDPALPPGFIYWRRRARSIIYEWLDSRDPEGLMEGQWGPTEALPQ